MNDSTVSLIVQEDDSSNQALQVDRRSPLVQNLFSQLGSLKREVVSALKIVCLDQPPVKQYEIYTITEEGLQESRTSFNLTAHQLKNEEELINILDDNFFVQLEQLTKLASEHKSLLSARPVAPKLLFVKPKKAEKA